MLTALDGLTYFQKLMLQMLQNLYLKLLCANFTSNWTYIKQIRKSVPVAPLNLTYLTSKKVDFSSVPKFTCLKLSWINRNYHIFENISI